MSKIDKIMGYINAGTVVYNIIIKAVEDPNYNNTIKWVVNDKWCRGVIGVEVKRDNGSDRMILLNSFDLANKFGGVEGIKRDMTMPLMNDKNITSFKFF